MLPSKLYNIVKYMVLIAIPAVSSAYFTLAGELNLPYARQVVGTLAVLATLLGTLTGVSSRIYNAGQNTGPFDGNLDIVESDTSLIHQLEIKTPPEQLADKDQVVFKVRKIPLELPPEDFSKDS